MTNVWYVKNISGNYDGTCICQFYISQEQNYIASCKKKMHRVTGPLPSQKRARYMLILQRNENRSTRGKRLETPEKTPRGTGENASRHRRKRLETPEKTPRDTGENASRHRRKRLEAPEKTPRDTGENASRHRRKRLETPEKTPRDTGENASKHRRKRLETPEKTPRGTGENASRHRRNQLQELFTHTKRDTPDLVRLFSR